MQLENLYFVSQILASLAVMASLIYLATQIRFAKLAAADFSRLTRVTGVRENLRETANNAELRKNWLKSTGLAPAYESLGSSLGVDADAAIQIDFMCQSWMWLHWGHYSSITKQSDLDELGHTIGMFYSAPPMSTCWAESPYPKALLTMAFIQFIDDAIAKNAQRTTPLSRKVEIGNQ